MRASTLVMIGFAVLFGLLAVFIAQAWLNSQAEMRMKSLEANKPTPAATKTIVVAAKPLRYGMELNAASLREIPWSEESVPRGAFTSIAEFLKGGKRVVLAPIEANEPVLALKVTGAGQRATLSSLVEDGMKAVTIRVNDVEGVGGFVLPGDHVDVLLTRQQERTNGINDVVIQNARVLAVDQLADDAADRPTVVKAVTIEVDTIGAQKIALASSLGNLSLMLRRAGEQVTDATRRVSTADLTETEVVQRAPEAKRFAKVSVTRGTNKQEYNVASEEAEWRGGADEQAAVRR